MLQIVYIYILRVHVLAHLYICAGVFVRVLFSSCSAENLWSEAMQRRLATLWTRSPPHARQILHSTRRELCGLGSSLRRGHLLRERESSTTSHGLHRKWHGYPGNVATSSAARTAQQVCRSARSCVAKHTKASICPDSLREPGRALQACACMRLQLGRNCLEPLRGY